MFNNKEKASIVLNKQPTGATINTLCVQGTVYNLYDTEVFRLVVQHVQSTANDI